MQVLWVHGERAELAVEAVVECCLLQNRHKELWSLLHWANPTLVSDWTSFSKHYVRALQVGQRKNATAVQLQKV